MGANREAAMAAERASLRQRVRGKGPPQPSAHEDPLLAVVPEAWVPSRDAAIRNAARHEERAKPYRVGWGRTCKRC